MLYGKGQHKRNLVYFQLDASFLRQPQNTHEGGYITVTRDEVIGIARNFFPDLTKAA